MAKYTRADILRIAADEDVEFIRLQFTDMFGMLKNIAITASQLPKALDNKYVFDGSSIDGCMRMGEEDMYLHPDLDTFVLLPWRPQQGKVARMLCDICKPDGTPLTTSPRTILKNVLKQAQEKGYTFLVDPECEFFLFHTDENGIPTTVTHEQAGYMDTNPLDLGENTRREIVLMLEEMGFEIESSHHETAPAQHEIDFKYAEALETADHIVTFKSSVRSIAKRFGLHATFMPKPKAGVAGSGMHLAFSMFKDGKNVFYDPEDNKGLSKEAYWFMGGLMAHAKGLCAITNPLVNSYKRLVSGFEAPRDIVWTTKNQSAMIRVPSCREEDTRIELRTPDPSANPYLALAVCIAAGLEGIEKQLEPGNEAPSGFSQRTEEQKAAVGVETLPVTLIEAVYELEKDGFLRTVLGGEFASMYVKAKKAEWQEYITQVTDWEVEKYLYRT